MIGTSKPRLICWGIIFCDNGRINERGEESQNLRLRGDECII